jgi:membrane protease YdiL (CAAX protease family)
MPWDFVLIFLVLGVLLPWRGQYRLRRLLELTEVTPKERIALYLSTIGFQWAAAAVVAWRAYARGLTWSELGLGRQSVDRLTVASIVGTLVLAGLHWMNLKRTGRAGDQRLGKLRAISQRILPQSRMELAAYLGLALTAGVCEEFLYRGFSMAALLRVGLPAWTVILVSSVLFGAAHLYQGRSGFWGTLILGVVFGIARIAYDSVVPVMFWHAAVDVVAGLAGPRYLLQKAGGGPESATI